MFIKFSMVSLTDGVWRVRYYVIDVLKGSKVKERGRNDHVTISCMTQVTGTVKSPLPRLGFITGYIHVRS